MMFGIIFSIALILTIVWGVMFLRQLRSGLDNTALDDTFTWGLYVQGFFFFSALAGGILIFMAVVTLFEIKTLASLVQTSAAVAFGCLVAAGLLLGSDLGKPLRSLKIITGGNFTSPLTWDFFTLAACAILNIIFLLGWVPMDGVLATIWSLLCLMAAVGFVMMHTLFFLSRVGSGFRSQPFLGLDTLAHSLWGGMALVTLMALTAGMQPFYMGRLLLILTVLTAIPMVVAHIAYLSNKRKGFDQKKILAMEAAIFVFLALIQLFFPKNTTLLALAAILVLLAVFMEKSHLIRQYQVKPTLPLPYSHYDKPPAYRATIGEWFLTVGGGGVCVLMSCIIIYLQGQWMS